MSKRFKSTPDLNGFVQIAEGTACIDLPAGKVFYNPVQEFNRDLSVAVINLFQQQYLQEKGSPHKTGISILEALSASGLRSIRYAKEISNVAKIVANDIDKEAVNLIEHNIQKNFTGTQDSKSLCIEPCQGDANFTMMKYSNAATPFDVIDLDPYGSAAPFIDMAVRTIADGGLICVTCTDLAVLCASYPETCYAKYSSIPLKGDLCHEMALRIVLSTIESCATKYKRYIVPLVSCSIDFYIRIFFRVFESPSDTKHAALRKSLVFRCVGCRTTALQPLLTLSKKGSSEKFHTARLDSSNLCENCNQKLEIAGPVFSAPMHQPDFVASLLDYIKPETVKFATKRRMMGLLAVIYEELAVPFYYSLPEVARVLKSSVPPLIATRSAFLNLGHSVSITHCSPQGLKTDAPPSVVWNVFSSWASNSNKSLNHKNNELLEKLVQKYQANSPINFEHHPDANPESRKTGLSRFPENPTKNWGPLSRAKSKSTQI